MSLHDQHFAPPSGLITLLTDFGNADGFVGAMKGVILGIHPRAHIIDLTHEVAPQDISAATFLLAAHFKYFPRGTVHVAVVDPGVGASRKALACYCCEHYFIAPDNGLLDFCAEAETCVAVELTRREFWRQEVSRTFHGRDIFAPVAAHLAAGVALAQLGEYVSLRKHGLVKKCETRGGALIGEIVYIDRFGNLISNISRFDFNRFAGNSSFTIRCGQARLQALTPAYGYARPGEVIALINSFDCLELGVVQGNAQTNLAIALGTPVIIKRGS
jgi:S-adenosylmethionine hydrolase